MLLLGGDAHYKRELLVRKMHYAGLLERSLWSLSTPDQCAPAALNRTTPALRATWAPFCKRFPKRLDIALHGPWESSNKDVSFPPRSLYRRTRFSAVFESVVSAPGDHPCYPSFLTEKVMKPLVRGHPFLIMCGAVKTLHVGSNPPSTCAPSGSPADPLLARPLSRAHSPTRGTFSGTSASRTSRPSSRQSSQTRSQTEKTFRAMTQPPAPTRSA